MRIRNTTATKRKWQLEEWVSGWDGCTVGMWHCCCVCAGSTRCWYCPHCCLASLPSVTWSPMGWCWLRKSRCRVFVCFSFSVVVFVLGFFCVGFVSSWKFTGFCWCDISIADETKGLLQGIGWVCMCVWERESACVWVCVCEHKNAFKYFSTL